MKDKRGFGMHHDQYPPVKCSDCGSKLSIPHYERTLGPWAIDCECGARYEWRNPWIRTHNLPLWRLVYASARGLESDKNCQK
jgi:hypothetical protein